MKRRGRSWLVHSIIGVCDYLTAGFFMQSDFLFMLFFHLRGYKILSVFFLWL